ncbi:MAG: hypothetical protein J6Q74_01600 [Clostridia bacterium]|nr:hypothetical protein [Clostridia bacterium]
MKKFTALALALAMLVSCMVFTASAEAASGVEFVFEAPDTVVADTTFEVKIRVEDENKLVGGIQGSISVTGATIKEVVVNPELREWNGLDKNDSSKDTTFFKKEGDNLVFATLNNLGDNSYATRLWFKVICQADTSDKVTIDVSGLKVSDKTAKLIDVDKTAKEINVQSKDTSAVVTLDDMSILNQADVMQQGILVKGSVSVPEAVLDTVEEIGVIFYPTSLLGGEALTVNTEGAAIASVKKGTADFNTVVTDGEITGLLKFGFTSKTNALKFLGTRVTARVYYKTANGVEYASNPSADAYISNGIGNKAALNTILDLADTYTPVNDNYVTAKAGLNTSVTGWDANREYVLKYCVENYSAQ